MRGIGRWVLALIACALATPASPALADEGALTADETARLARGEIVVRSFEFERDSGDYVGGVAYIVVKAPVGAVMGTLMDVPAYQKFMPMTLDARISGVDGRDVWVYLRHGNSLGEAAYTVRARRDGARTLRFWIDGSKDRDIDDLWGYWRVQPLPGGQTLLTYAAALDVGGILELLETRIRNYAINTPKKLRDLVEERVKRLDRPLERTARLAATQPETTLADIRVDGDTRALRHATLPPP